MNSIIRKLLLSIILYVIGIAFNYILLILIDIPGKNKIDRKYQNSSELHLKKKQRKTVIKIYRLILITIIVMLNIFTYYLEI